MMELVRVGKQYRITIPKRLCEDLRLRIGDYVAVGQEDGKVVIKPVEVKAKR